MNLYDRLKTILFNFRMFDFNTAIKMPVYVAGGVNIEKLQKGCIKLNVEPGKMKRGMVKIGFDTGSSGVLPANYKSGHVEAQNSSTITFNGKATIAQGSTLKAIEGGCIEIGDRFWANTSLKVLCKKSIMIGNDVLIGWNITMDDGDGHPIYNIGDEDNRINANKPIAIGNHVWLGAEVSILKGASIPSGCIVGFRSIVTKKFDKENAVIVGAPALVVKENTEWRH